MYKVAEWHPATPPSNRNEALVTRELFKKRENGSFTTTNIKKRGKGEFIFGPKAHLHTYKVEGYLHQPEGVSPMSMVVNPQKNDGQPPKEKSILGIKLTHRDGTAVTKALSYRDQLRATAKCQNLEGQSLIFTLWEDDEKGAGHNVKNQNIIQSPPIRVDSKGFARWEFGLLNTFIALANQREDDKKQHEYYVTAEYNGKQKASNNVNANNPEYTAPTSPPKPKANSPKVSTNPASRNNQADPKGYVTKIELYDKDMKPFKARPRFGDVIQLVIEAKNVGGLEYRLKLWEHDYLGKDDLLYDRVHTFKSDKNAVNVRQAVSICLIDEYRKIGETGNDPKNPDTGEYLTGNHQEIFAEVIFDKVSAKSSVIDVGINAEPQVPQPGVSPVIAANNQTVTNTSCICRDKYKNLYWGEKVSCDFRKKVIEIAKRLNKDPNLLMAGMALETGRTFSPTAGKGSSYVGLIQFGDDAAASVGTTRAKLLQMTAIEQLDYVEKYLQKKKDKIYTLTDFYLSILMPVDVGKGKDRDFVVF